MSAHPAHSGQATAGRNGGTPSGLLLVDVQIDQDSQLPLGSADESPRNFLLLWSITLLEQVGRADSCHLTLRPSGRFDSPAGTRIGEICRTAKTRDSQSDCRFRLRARHSSAVMALAPLHRLSTSVRATEPTERRSKRPTPEGSPIRLRRRE